LPNEEDLTSFPGSLKAVKKRVFNGVAWFVFQPDTMELYWQRDEDVSPVLVADFTLTAEVYHNSIWKSRQFSFEESGITKTVLANGGVRFQARKEDTVPFGTGLWGLRVFWEQGKVKFVFYADMPGLPIRLKWAIYFDESRKAQADEKGISWSIADYDGNIDSTVEQDDVREGWRTKTWTFEPDGHACPALDGGETLIQRYQAGKGLLVDPYLTISEAATEFFVTCDGFIYSCRHGDTETYDQLQNLSQTQLFLVYDDMRSDGVTYGLHFDRTRIATVVENTPERIVLRKVGNFEDTSQNALDTDDVVTCFYSIYPDRVIIHMEWADNAQTDIDNNVNNRLVGILAKAAITEEKNIAEITGAEKYHEEDGEDNPDLVSTVQTGDYIGAKSTQMNVILVDVAHTDDSDFDLYCDSAGRGFARWNDNATFPAATHTMTVAMLIDSAERANDVGATSGFWNWDDDTLGNAVAVGKIILNDGIRYICYAAIGTAAATHEPGVGVTWTDFWHEYRLTLGDQYKDNAIDQSPTPETGDVDDMVIPARINTGTMHSDGAHHYTAANSADGVTDITMDISRIRPSFVVHDPVFHSGTVASPTDHLVGWWKLDDTDADTTIDDSSGNDYDGALEGGNTLNNLTGSDAIRGTALTQDATDDSFEFDSAFAALPDKTKFTVIVAFKPTFAYNVGSDANALFSIYYDGDDYVKIYYETSEPTYYIRARINNNNLAEAADRNLNIGTFTTDLVLQQWNIFMVSVDLSESLISVAWNGKVVKTYITPDTSWGTTPTQFDVGNFTSDESFSATYDDIKLLDGCILPYGAYHIGNGSGLLADIDNPHKNLTFFWDCQAVGAACAKGGTDLGSDITGTIGSSGGSIVESGGLVGPNYYDNESGSSNYYISFPLTASEIDFKKGSISIVFSVTTYGDTKFLFGVGNVDDQITMYTLNTGQALFRYETGGTREQITDTTAGLNSPGIHFAKLTWDDSDYTHFYMDGTERGTPQSVANAWGGGTSHTLYIGASYAAGGNLDFSVHSFSISNDPNTPEIWTAFGKPLHINLTDVS